MRCFKLIVMLFFLNLFLNCARNSSESTNDINENKRPSRFVKSTGLANYRIFKSEFERRFKGDDLPWEKEKNVLYVVLADSVKYADFYILSLMSDSNNAEIYKIFSIESYGGMWFGEFDKCMEKKIKENGTRVYELCRKKIFFQESLIKKMKHFLFGGISIVGYVDYKWHPCLGRDLHMFYYDGNNYFYFDMDDPTCFDDNMKKDPRITEYIEFYNEMAAFIKQDFSECRWDNFGNKDKMIEECSQYNWKWRERYGK